ncbi:MAG TPA: AAA family ATPase [Mucilaginibacter sp.]|jgi:predicted ABC-type ATPase
MSNSPQLLFVAGPNGAGKSTLSKELSEPNAIIFDVDKVIAQIEAQSPGISKKQVYQAATEEFYKQANQAIRQKQHFTLETNFRDEGLVDIVSEFKRFGYITNMVYLTLERIEQSMDRVNQRVKNGGHYVDLKNIRQNYTLGLEYLERFAGRFDNLEIVDASGSAGRLRSLLSIRQNQLVFLTGDPPEWIIPTLNGIAARFSQNDRGADNDEIRSPPRGR